MWYLSILPNSVFHAILALGILAILASMFLKVIPFISNYYIPMRVVGFVLFVFGVYFEGQIANEAGWIARVKEMEAKIAVAEAKSKEVNVQIEEKVITKTKVVKEKGDEIIKYIDRELIKNNEIIKYVENCPIPKEVIELHNAAAIMNEASKGDKK